MLAGEGGAGGDEVGRLTSKPITDLPERTPPFSPMWVANFSRWRSPLSVFAYDPPPLRLSFTADLRAAELESR